MLVCKGLDNLLFAGLLQHKYLCTYTLLLILPANGCDGLFLTIINYTYWDNLLGYLGQYTHFESFSPSYFRLSPLWSAAAV